MKINEKKIGGWVQVYMYGCHVEIMERISDRKCEIKNDFAGII